MQKATLLGNFQQQMESMHVDYAKRLDALQAQIADLASQSKSLDAERTDICGAIAKLSAVVYLFDDKPCNSAEFQSNLVELKEDASLSCDSCAVCPAASTFMLWQHQGQTWYAWL